MLLAKVLRKDKKYKKLSQVLEVAQQRINVEQDRVQAFSLHAGLESRSLYGKRALSPKAVLSATSQMMANRSRLVEMRARATENISYLHQACKEFKRYALTAYEDEFKDYRTKEQRDALLDVVMRPALEFIGEADTLIDILDNLIKDIDQSGHSVRHIVDILKLLDSSKTGQTI